MANYIPLEGYEMPDGSTNIFGRLLGYDVIGADSESIGTVDSVWLDDSYQQGFVAITTGWLIGRQCLIPTDSLQVDHDMRRLTIPYTKDKVKKSPDVATDYEVTSDEARQVREYYGLGQVNEASGMIADTSTHTDFETTTRTATPTPMATPIETRIETGDLTSRAETDTTEIPLSEESVHVGKRQVQSGTVRLRKVIRTETVNMPVELRHEDIVIERVDPSDTTQTGQDGIEFVEDEIEIPLTREEVVVQKTTEVTGAVRVRKVSDSEQQNVTETVRKEDVEVQRTGETGETTLSQEDISDPSNKSTPRKRS